VGGGEAVHRGPGWVLGGVQVRARGATGGAFLENLLQPAAPREIADPVGRAELLQSFGGDLADVADESLSLIDCVSEGRETIRIGDIDRHVVGPIVSRLERFGDPDHPPVRHAVIHQLREDEPDDRVRHRAGEEGHAQAARRLPVDGHLEELREEERLKPTPQRDQHVGRFPSTRNNAATARPARSSRAASASPETADFRSTPTAANFRPGECTATGRCTKGTYNCAAGPASGRFNSAPRSAWFRGVGVRSRDA